MLELGNYIFQLKDLDGITIEGMKYQGSVSAVADLPTASSSNKGWVYTITANGHEYVSDGSQWVDLSADLENKVDKVTGKGLSTNDFTTAEKTILNNSIELKVEYFRGYFAGTGWMSYNADNDEQTTNLIPVFSDSSIRITKKYSESKVRYVEVGQYDVNKSYLRKSRPLGGTTDDEIDVTISNLASDVAYISISLRTYGEGGFDSIVHTTTHNNSLLNDVDSKFLTTEHLKFEIGYDDPRTSSYAFDAGLGNKQSVKLQDGYALKLYAGDFVTLSDFTNANFRMMRVMDDNRICSLGTSHDESYVIANTGLYKININATDESVQTSPDALASLLRVVRKTDCNALLEAEKIVPLRNNNIVSISHRGSQLNAPENTMPAFYTAMKKGFPVIETDVRFTSDGIPVLMHDDTVDRTSSGTGNINTFTLEQVKELDFGSWFDSSFAGTTIPTLEEFLLFCKRTGVVPLIELKEGNNETQANIESCVTLVKNLGMESYAKWTAYSDTYLGYVKALIPTAELLIIGSSTTAAQTLIDKYNTLKTSSNKVVVSTGAGDTVINALKAENIPVYTWAYTYVGSMVSLNPYVSGVTSNTYVPDIVSIAYASYLLKGTNE